MSSLRLPVMLYHHVGPPAPDTYPSLTILPEQFERQIRWLVRRRYVGISPSDWLACCRQGKQLPDKPVLLTFDDAYADLVEYAFPLLRRNGFGAGVYVVTSQVGKTNAWDEGCGSGTHRLMSGAQILHWHDHGIEFGAHSRTHADLTALAGEGLKEEIAGSGSDLTGILGTPVKSFAYPYGFHNCNVRNFVREGFDLAFTIEEGLNSLQTDRYLLRRTMVQPNDTIMDFACRVTWGWSPIQRLRSGMATAIRPLRGRNQ